MKYYFIVFVCLFIQIKVFAQLEISDKGTSVSMTLMDISSNRYIVHQKSDQRLIPASLTKIITTSAALQLLGPDFCYKTKFICEGEIIDDQLNGNLIIESGGDPTLGSVYFDETNPDILFSEVLQWLQNIGIRQINGQIYVKSETIPYSSPRLWEDIGNYYGGYPRGFNWKDNTVKVLLSSKEKGTLCDVVSIEPDIKPYELNCKVIAANHNKDSAYVFGLPEMNKWWIEGSIPSNRSAFKIKAAMPDPEKTFIDELTTYLVANDIAINHGCILNTDIRKERLIYAYHSPKLSEIIKLINHKSNNLFADMLLLTLSKEYRNVYSWDLGTQIIKGYWNEKVDFENHFRIKDGSGLTPKNIISTKGMVDLLCWMKENSNYFEVFKSSLAIGGESGTLKSVFRHSDLKNRIYGKSGSMEGVLGYCGYYIDSKSEYIAFCVITNNYLLQTKEVRTQIDNTLTKLFLDH